MHKSGWSLLGGWDLCPRFSALTLWQRELELTQETKVEAYFPGLGKLSKH
jgi:hypothetical protein